MKNKQHLIALDLDGTLLTDTKEITHHTKQIIKQTIKEGHIVIIATGRPHRASIQYYKMLGLTTPMVNFNGALIHHPQDKSFGLFHHPLPNKTALSVVDACLQLDVHNIMAEVLDTAYLERHDQEIIDIFQSVQAKESLSPFIIGDIKQKLKDDPTSMLIRPKEDHLDELKNHLDGYVEFIEHRNWGAPWNITEITKKGIHKAIGLKKVADYYQIPQHRIIAFGDEDNDLEMIDYAGVGVAMENGISELKSIANHTTSTNQLDGVATFLESYLKIKVTVS